MKNQIICRFLAIGFFSFLCISAHAQASQRGPNILLITIDTLRADHLSSDGYHLLTTPRLDQLAQQGARFARAYTPVPYTGPAHVSILTGRYPQEHGAKVNGQPRVDDARLLTLAQYLKVRGYRTAAFVSAWPLKSGLTNLSPGFDLYDEDFDRWYQMVNTYRSAEDLNPKAIRWLEGNHRVPFFLWLHYFDPHAPYQLRQEFSKLPANPQAQRQAPKLKRGARDRVRNYDSEVAFTDSYVGKLIDALDRLGEKDSTLVIVTSDHGESLGEHGYVGHGKYLYEPTVRVPLIVRYPQAVKAGTVVAQPTSTLDLMPTLLEMTGIKPIVPLPGKSFREQLGSTETAAAAREKPHPLYMVTFAGKKWQMPGWFSWLWYSDARERLPLRLGRIEGNEKIIWSPGDKKLQTFHLTDDPREVEAISSADAGKAQVNFMRDWFKTTALYLDQPSPLSDRDKEALRSLGYAVH